MSSFLTSIPVDVESVKALLPRGSSIEGLNYNRETHAVELTWSNAELLTKYSFHTPFSVEQIKAMELPQGVTRRVTIVNGPMMVDEAILRAGSLEPEKILAAKKELDAEELANTHGNREVLLVAAMVAPKKAKCSWCGKTKKVFWSNVVKDFCSEKCRGEYWNSEGFNPDGSVPKDTVEK